MQQLTLLCLSFVLALYLYLIPLPEQLVNFKPQWFVLTFIYWNIAIPHRIGVLLTIGLGLILDIIEGDILGRHAVAFLTVHLICVFGYQRFRVFSNFQQCLLIFGIICIYLAIFYWFGTLFKNTGNSIAFLGSALSSAIIWPLVFSFLRFFRRKYKIN